MILMRKTYVFITNEIGNVGGGQLYLRRKAGALRAAGWRVLIFHFLKRGRVLPGLEDYQNGFIRGMQIPYGAHTERSRRRWLGEMYAHVVPEIDEGRPEKVLIESYSPAASLWGEGFAHYLCEKGIAAINLHYHLLEEVKVRSRAERELMDFKARHNQLRFINRQVAAAAYPEMDAARMTLWVGFTPGDNIGDVACPALKEKDNERFTMLMVTRLEKPYVRSSMENISRFAASHPQSFFDLILIGGAPSGKIRREVLAPLRRLRNIKIYELGYQNPIPRETIEAADVAIASSGTVWVLGSQGLPSIAVDSRSHRSPGIWGEDTMSALRCGEEEPLRDVAALLEREYSRRRPGEKRRLKAIPEIATASENDFGSHFRWMEEVEENPGMSDVGNGDIKIKAFGKETIKNWPGIDKICPESKKEKIFNKILRLNGEKLVYLLKIIGNALGR